MRIIVGISFIILKYFADFRLVLFFKECLFRLSDDFCFYILRGSSFSLEFSLMLTTSTFIGSFWWLFPNIESMDPVRSIAALGVMSRLAIPPSPFFLVFYCCGFFLYMIGKWAPDKY